MPEHINQRTLRNESGRIMRAVVAGQTFVVTRNGTPIAELRPIGPRRFVPREVLAERAKTAPRIDFQRFRDDIDAVVDPYLHLDE